MTRTEAILFLGFMLGRVGGGYHPDNCIGDYTGGFTDEEVESMRLQRKHDAMLGKLGTEEILAITLKFLAVV